MPKWTPVDFVKHCISDLGKLLSGEHDRACVPVWFCDFDGVTVPSCYWGLNRIDSSTIGFNEVFRYEDEHFKSVHGNHKDWWKDVSDIHEHWLGTTDCRDVGKWLDFYGKLVACAEGKQTGRCFKSAAEHFSLTPFMCVGDGIRVCGLQMPSIDCDLIVDAKPSKISSGAYLDCWRVEMMRLLDGKCDAAVLALDAGKNGAVTKWIGMTREDPGYLIMSALQDCILDGCMLIENGSALAVSLKPNAEATILDVSKWAKVTVEDAERWVYWAGTVLAGIKTVDDDPDILPCHCGIKDL